MVLHEPVTGSDYTVLHDKAEALGAKRYVQSDEGKWFDLPPAEYLIDTDKTMQEIRAEMMVAGQATGKLESVYIVNANGVVWYGLKEIPCPAIEVLLSLARAFPAPPPLTGLAAFGAVPPPPTMWLKAAALNR